MLVRSKAGQDAKARVTDMINCKVSSRPSLFSKGHKLVLAFAQLVGLAGFDSGVPNPTKFRVVTGPEDLYPLLSSFNVLGYKPICLNQFNRLDKQFMRHKVGVGVLGKVENQFQPRWCAR